ncbi:MAG: FHA domain-containing protein [Caldilineaceae bacterium]
MQHIVRFRARSLYLLLLLAALLAAASLFAPQLHAQDAVEPFLAFAKVDSSHFPAVQVAVYGDPGSGGIADLPIQVRENDQVQTILTDTTAAVGTQLAIVLDPHDLTAAGSSGQTHQAEVAVLLLNLIEKGVVVRNQDWLAVFSGSSSGAVSTIQDWTGERNLIFNSTVQSSVDPAVDDSQLTALTLGVLDKFEAPAPANLARAILLFTAGSSKLDVESAVARANSANVRIHVIELANQTAPPAGESALRELAARTNGAFVRLQGVEDQVSMWRRLSALRTQRVLSYTSSAAAPVSLTVELAGDGGVPLAATADLAVPAAPQAAAAQAAGEASTGAAQDAVPTPVPTAAPASVPTTATATAPATAAATVEPTAVAAADAPADLPATDLPAVEPTAASGDTPAAGELVAVADSRSDQLSSRDDPVTPADDTAPVPASDTVFVPGTTLALPRPLLEMALPILLVLLTFFAFREVRERRKSSKQQRTAAATKAPPATVAAVSAAAPAAEDDLDELQPLQPRKQPAVSTSEVAASAAALELAAAHIPAPVRVEDDEYDEATVVPLRFSDDEATYRLRETIDMPLLGVLVRVTNDPNLPQQLPVYGLNPGPGEARQIHIGRHSKNNTVVINDKSISREHAVIIQKDGRLYLRDNASTAGTYLNWRQLKPGEELLLRHNDLISFGEIVYEFRAKGEDEATVVSG